MLDVGHSSYATQNVMGMLDEVIEINTSASHECSQHVYCEPVFVWTEWGTCIRHQSTGTEHVMISTRHTDRY